MDYRMEHKDRLQFLSLVRAFSNESFLDDNGHSIPAFWTECHEKNLVEPIRQLRPAGKRDLYGLCGPTRDTDTHFNYSIGILVDADTDADGLALLTGRGYSLWETVPTDYAVFKCCGADGDCIGETWDKFYKEFSPQTGYTQTDGADFELYYEQGEAGVFCELWIPVKAERQNR